MICYAFSITFIYISGHNKAGNFLRQKWVFLLCHSQYEAVDERDPGEQGQVDMGEIYVPTLSGRNKKIYCFAMVLAHSRYKFILWQERPFTTDSFVRAHISAFEFFGGRPREIVYDQDKVLAVSENNGDIIYTTGFQNYINEVKFSIFLCHGADPESSIKRKVLKVFWVITAKVY